MAQVDYSEQLEDVVNGLEDLAAAFKAGNAMVMPKMPTPVVRVDTPAAIVPPAVVNVEPSVIVQQDRQAYTVTVQDRDMAGKIKSMQITPIL